MSIFKKKDSKICYRCSTQNPHDAFFCRNCGVPLTRDALFQDSTKKMKLRRNSMAMPYVLFLIVALIIGLAVGLVSSLSVFKK
ncbi:zinc ribbon domain-containing protein [Thermodesulfobium sp. 4217-1]|uniref:zinc ribbon domain-containing protein n=1 Tax=Thermodesulfobium sp. 4217-1 TaxID=3120013 RepID=UPI00322193C4